MRIAVMGAGAVGLLYGGWLQMAGAEVTFIARGSRLLALRNQPLTAVGRVPFRLDSVDVVESVAKLAPVDVLLLATKLYDLQAAAVSALPALSRTGVVVAVQNGISAYRVLSALVPSTQIAVGPVYALTKITGPASVAYGGIERAILGNPDHEVKAPVAELVRLWRDVGIDASLADDINNVLWTKFIGLATSAALNCISKLPAGIVYHEARLVELVKQSIHEVIAVGTAEGVKFAPSVAHDVLGYLQSLPPETVASMRRDLDAGHRLELEGLSGEVMRLGQMHGIATPLHTTTYALLKPFCDGPPAAQKVDGRPKPESSGQDFFPPIVSTL